MPDDQPHDRVPDAAALVQRAERGQRHQTDPVRGAGVRDDRLRPGPARQVGEQHDGVGPAVAADPVADLQHRQGAVGVEGQGLAGQAHLPLAVAVAGQVLGQFAGQPGRQLGGQAGVGHQVDDGGAGDAHAATP